MSDVQLIGRILAGETSEYAALVERYLPMVRALCATHVLTPSACDDLVQETFVAGYTKLNSLRNHERFGPWLAGIARNRCRLWVRAHTRKERAHKAMKRAAADAHAPSPMSDVARAELREWVHGRIASLPRKTREAMALCYIEGRTVAEAARFLDVSEAAVKKRLEYGRKLVGAELMKEAETRGGGQRDYSDVAKQVLAAVPLGTLPWKAASATSALGGLLGIKTLVAACSLVAAIALTTAWVVQGGLPSVRTSPVQPTHLDEPSLATASAPAQPSPNTEPAPSEEPAPEGAAGTLTVRVCYRETISTPASLDGLKPVPGAKVRAVPMRFDEAAFNALMDEAGLDEEGRKAISARFRIVPRRNMAKDWLAEAGVDKETLVAAMRQLEEYGKRLPGEEFGQRLEAAMRAADFSRASEPRTASPDGKVRFDGLEPGRYVLQTLLPGEKTPWPAPPGRGRSAADSNTSGAVVFADAPSEQTALVADTVSAIKGVVLDADTGDPVKQVTVKITGDAAGSEHVFDATTNKDGRFSFSPFMGYGPFELDCTSQSHKPVIAKGVREPGVPMDLTIKVAAQGTISGHVYKADGKPAVGVSVMRAGRLQSGWRGIAVTDENGFYRGSHTGGPQKLYAGGGPGPGVSSPEIELALKPGEDVVQDFTLPQSARVVFDIRTPWGFVPDRVEDVAIVNEGGTYCGYLKKQGKVFVIPFIGPGTYDVLFTVEGYHGVRQEVSIQSRHEEEHYSIRLSKPKPSIRVRTLDSNGRPRQGSVGAFACIPDYDRNGNVSGGLYFNHTSTGTDENGEGVFMGLPPGVYQLSCGGQKEYVTAPHSGVVVFKSDPVEQVFRLFLGDHAIRAFDEQGNRLQGDRGDIKLYTVPPQGEPSSSGALEVGSNTLCYVQAGRTAVIEAVEVTQAFWDDKLAPPRSNVYGDKDVTIHEGGGVYGAARRADGNPLYNARLLVYPAAVWERVNLNNSDWRGLGKMLAQQSSCNEDGTFALGHLPPGDYVVVAQHSDGEAVSDVVRVEAGKETGPLELVK